MGDNPTNGDLNGLIEELKAVSSDTQKTFGALSSAQLNWKPAPEEWSVAQCFDHLIVTNRRFFPLLEQAARGEYAGSFWERVSPFSGLFGRIVVGTLKNPGRKFKAPPTIQPSKSDIDAAVLANFVEHQGELIEHMRAVEGVNLKGLKVTSPIAAFMTYSMFDALRIVVAHEQRHFAQARRVLEREGFPR
jgi:hypothetical protein